MFGSKSREIAQLRADKADLTDQLAAERRNQQETVGGAAAVAHRYNQLARVIAVHVVTAEEHDVDIHPSTLRAAIERARIDLAAEYARAGRSGATT